VTGSLHLDQAVFAKRVNIAVLAHAVSCTRTQFSDGATLEVFFATVTLKDTQFLAPSRLVGTISGFSEEQYHQFARQHDETDIPQLLSLEGTDVTDLRLSNVDLGLCAFAGAQNLQTLRAQVAGIPTPKGWYWGRTWPPIWRWTRRNALMEEHRWRLILQP
jgi:hypothetical protein